jgi:hypothetical protein
MVVDLCAQRSSCGCTWSTARIWILCILIHGRIYQNLLYSHHFLMGRVLFVTCDLKLSRATPQHIMLLDIYKYEYNYSGKIYIYKTIVNFIGLAYGSFFPNNCINLLR